MPADPTDRELREAYELLGAAQSSIERIHTHNGWGVTRSDRQTAADLAYLAPHPPDLLAWIETGDGDAAGGPVPHDIAQAIATARAEGYAAGVRAGVEAERDARDVCGCGDVLCEPERRPTCETCHFTNSDEAERYPTVDEVVASALAAREGER